MGTIMKIYGPGDIRFDSYDERDLASCEVRIKTLFSGISAGTEMTHYKGSNPYRTKKWDEQRKLFASYGNHDYYPRATGYEEVGEVVEVGREVRDISPGEIVFGAWTHKSMHIMTEEEAVRNRLFPELEPIQGIFAQIGSIALNGILDARLNVGETAAIFGQGTPGLICTQLAKLSGAKVIAVDLHDRRLELAKSFGADFVLNASGAGTAEAIKDITGGLGADTCIEVSGSAAALHHAVKACAYGGNVVALGFFQGEAAGLFLGEEFHHNRISIVCSQIGGINANYVYRWNRQRLNNTVMELQRDGKLRLKELITHTFKFEEAAAAYRLISEKPSEVLQSVLYF